MSYLMESKTEGNRLEKKTDAEETFQQLQRAGLCSGMKALDAGAGTGAVARVMTKIVGDTGSVAAMDISTERLDQGRKIAEKEGIADRIAFWIGDMREPPFARNSLDFVWCRFVIEYMEKPDQVIKRLLSIVKRGGILTVADLDGNMIFHDGMEPKMEKIMNQLMKGLKGTFDPYAGRKLYRYFYQLGMTDIQVHCQPYHMFAGAIPDDRLENWKDKFATIRPMGSKILGSVEKYDEFAEYYIDFLQRPDTLTYSLLFLVSGKKA